MPCKIYNGIKINYKATGGIITYIIITLMVISWKKRGAATGASVL
jgi:hypothetical protein